MLIGIKNLYAAVISSEGDSDTNPTYKAPFKIPNINEIGISPNTGVVDFDGDNNVAVSITYISDIEVTLTLAELPLEIQAVLLGHTIDDGMIIESTEDEPPYIALGYEATKDNGKSIYVWYFKGKFMVPDESAATKGETPELQPDTIVGTFSGRKKDLAYKKFADADSPSYEDVSDTWFSSVLDGGSSTPYVFMAEPFNGETDVAVDQDIVIVFNEEMDATTIDATSITLNDGASVSVSVSVGSDNKTVTITPDVSMDAATEHTLSLATSITDADGNAITATDIVFTTA